MVRANRLALVNPSLPNKTKFDDIFSELGGVFFTNFFTPGPDTPRSMAAYWSGKNPIKNGCDTRLKWPQYFLHNNQKTILDIFRYQSYQMDFFSFPNERRNGLFPSSFVDHKNHNKDFDFRNFLDNLTLKDKHFIFISIPDFHWALDDYGYNLVGEKKGQEEVKKSYDMIFEKFHKDDFDVILIFSDHGFKFGTEISKRNKLSILDYDRTNCVLFYREKGDKDIVTSDKLLSITDMFCLYEQFALDGLNSNPFSKIDRKFVAIEDHLDFSTQINQPLGVWALTTINRIYIRSLTSAVTINKENEIIDNCINKEYDEILGHETQFKRYNTEIKKLNDYHNYIKTGDKYVNGNDRRKPGKFKRFINSKRHLLIN
jgi:hypothetical protein